MKKQTDRISFLEKEIVKGDRVLDIGCWDGARVARLTNFCDAYGLDIDENKLNLAQEDIKKRLHVADITKKVPFKNKFDWAFCTEVIEHVKNDKKLISNCNKVLKKGGILILTTPKKINGLDFWDPAWVRWKLGFGERHYHYSKQELFSKLEKGGFYIERFYVGGSLRWLIFRWINVFLKYFIKTGKQINNLLEDGYFDWIIMAKKIK